MTESWTDYVRTYYYMLGHDDSPLWVFGLSKDEYTVHYSPSRILSCSITHTHWSYLFIYLSTGGPKLGLYCLLSAKTCNVSFICIHIIIIITITTITTIIIIMGQWVTQNVWKWLNVTAKIKCIRFRAMTQNDSKWLKMTQNDSMTQKLSQFDSVFLSVHMCISVCIYTHTYTHTHTYIYIILYCNIYGITLNTLHLIY